MTTSFSDLILRGATGTRPTAGKPGRLFFDTTLNKMQRDNGSSWDDVESTVSAYTDEMAQDAIGAMIADTDTLDLTYTDGTPELKGDVKKQMSITSDASGLKLSGDAASPGSNKVYGTDGSGVKGWKADPTAGGAGSDSTAIHDDTANEISALTEKTTLAGDDIFIIEDSAASYVKKKVKSSNVGGGGSGGTGVAGQIVIAANAAPASTTWNDNYTFSVDRAGDYLLFATLSAYSTSANVAITLKAKIDTVEKDSQAFYINPSGQHMVLPPLIAKVTLTAGSHTLNLSVTGTHTCDSNDGASAFIVSVGSGGGVANIRQSYAGYDAIGASYEAMTQYKMYAKKITVTSDCLISSISAYVRGIEADQIASLACAVFSDISGTPGLLLHVSPGRDQSLLLDTTSGAGGINARWLNMAVGLWVTAGDYWIGIQHQGVAKIEVAYDGSGSDRTYTAGGAWLSDWGWYSPTTTSNKYSIRANLIAAANLTTTNTSISPTTSNVTAVVWNRYFADISGLTANRNFVLPTCAVGDEIELKITTGDDTYALIVIGDTGVTIEGGSSATEWSRLFISGEMVRFVASATNTWRVVYDGRKRSIGRMKLSSNITTNTAGAETTPDWGAADLNVGDICDLTNDRFNIRRAGIYRVSGGYRPVTAVSAGQYAQCLIYTGATLVDFAGMRQSTTSVLINVGLPARDYSFAAGDPVTYKFLTEESNRGMEAHVSSFFQIEEVL